MCHGYQRARHCMCMFIILSVGLCLTVAWLVVSLLVIALSPNSICFPQSSTHPLHSSNSLTCIYLTTYSLLFLLGIKPNCAVDVVTLCLTGLKAHSNGQHNPKQLCDCLFMWHHTELVGKTFMYKVKITSMMWHQT